MYIPDFFMSAALALKKSYVKYCVDEPGLIPGPAQFSVAYSTLRTASNEKLHGWGLEMNPFCGPRPKTNPVQITFSISRKIHTG